MEKKNILITSVGRRVSLIKIFKKELIGYFPEAKLFTIDNEPELSPAAQMSDNFFKICKIDNPLYIEELLEICLTNGIGLVIPTIDTELVKLSDNIDRFKNQGIDIVICNPEWINIFASKIKTHEFFKEEGIATSEVYSKEIYKFPIFIKPVEGSGSSDNFLINSEKDFTQNHFSNTALSFFEYIDPEQFDEYTCDLYYNKLGYLKCAIPRRRLKTRGGEVSKGKTIKNSLLSMIENKFSYFDGMRGTITVQFFMNKTDASIIGIEVNPRFGGGFPLSYQAGGNYPKWIIEEYFLNKELEYTNNWQQNLLMLRFDDAIFVSE